MPLPIEVKKLIVADLDEVMAIETQNFKFPWPKAFFLNDLASPQSICLAGWIDNKLVSYVMAMPASVELHITNIAVREGYQRRGIGSYMMAELEKCGRDCYCTYAYLEVRISNLPAIELYKKIGYHIAYSRKNYYLDGEDAFVMEKML